MNSPRLMIAPVDPGIRMSAAQIAVMREQLRELDRRGDDVIFTFAVNIWQLVDGRWEALPTNTQSEAPDGTQVIRPRD